MPIGPGTIRFSALTARVATATTTALIASPGTTSRLRVLGLFIDNSGADSEAKVVGGTTVFADVKSLSAVWVDFSKATNGIGIPTEAVDQGLDLVTTGATVDCFVFAICRAEQES